MPNADRNLFFEHHGKPTQRTWQEGYSELSLKVYRAFDRVRQLAQQTATSLLRDVVHRYLIASQEGSRVFVDFRLAQAYTLILDANVSELVFLPPVMAVDRACSLRIELIQAGAGGFTVTAWTDAVYATQLVFYAPDSTYMNSGLPSLSTTSGYVDVVAFSYDGFSEQLRGMYTKGASA